MVSAEDRAKMRRVAADLALGEVDERGDAQQRQEILGYLNADRTAHGFEPFNSGAPEEGLYDRAKSLGMARVDR